jgi:hypothetical protein
MTEVIAWRDRDGAELVTIADGVVSIHAGPIERWASERAAFWTETERDSESASMWIRDDALLMSNCLVGITRALIQERSRRPPKQLVRVVERDGNGLISSVTETES